MYHRKAIKELVDFISNRDGIADKGRLAAQVQQEFCLKKAQRILWRRFCHQILFGCLQKLQQYRFIAIRTLSVRFHPVHRLCRYPDKKLFITGKYDFFEKNQSFIAGAAAR